MRTALRSVLLAGVAVAGIACGGGGGGGSTDTGPATPTDASNPSDPGSPANPSDPSSPSTPSTPAGPPTVTAERLDAAAECDGLVPARFPLPIAVTRTPPAGASCAGGVSDGTGHVALAATDASGDAVFQLRMPGGDALGELRAHARMVPQASGWHAVAITTVDRDVAEPYGTGSIHVRGIQLEHLVVAADGSIVQRTVVSPYGRSSLRRWTFGEDPLGGSVVQVHEVDMFGNHFHGIGAHRFDAAGARLHATPIAYGSQLGDFMAGAASNRGGTLHLSYAPGSSSASWRDRDGARLQPDGEEPIQDVLGGITPDELERAEFVLSPLLDGGLVLGSHGRYYRAWPYLAETSAPLPDWLAARQGRSFRFTRGNRGYAVFPTPGASSPGCTQDIELLAPSGRLCGRVVLHEDGSGCTTGAVDQGWDGTVVQQSGHDACSYRWWPGLLGGG